MQSTDTNTTAQMTDQQYEQLLAFAIKECRREKIFPRDHRVFLAGLVSGMTAMLLLVLYV